MPWPWQRRERDAERLENVASLLDAGLDLGGALAASARGSGPPPSLERGAVPALATAGFALDEIDRAVLEAAEHSGDLVRALRDRADARRAQAGILALLATRLAYPALVLTLASIVAAWLAVLGLGGLPWLPVVVAIVVAASVAVVAWILRSARHDPDFTARRVPPLASLLRAWGEAPYLDATRSLYGAGVPIDRAHELATRAVPFAHLRARLTSATSRLGDRLGYVESLNAAGALDEEVRSILDAGERAGQLEEALARCALRQREIFRSRLKAGAVAIGAAAYAIAVLVVVLVVWDFYGGLWSRVSGR